MYVWNVRLAARGRATKSGRLCPTADFNRPKVRVRLGVLCPKKSRTSRIALPEAELRTFRAVCLRQLWAANALRSASGRGPARQRRERVADDL